MYKYITATLMFLCPLAFGQSGLIGGNNNQTTFNSITGSSVTLRGSISIASQPRVKTSFPGNMVVTANAWNKVYFSTSTNEEYNYGQFSHVLASSDVFSVPSAGFYLTTCKIMFASSSGGTFRGMRLVYQGLAESTLFIPSFSASVETSMIDVSMKYLNQNDNISCQVYQDTSGNLNIEGTSNYSGIEIVKLF